MTKLGMNRLTPLHATRTNADFVLYKRVEQTCSCRTRKRSVHVYSSRVAAPAAATADAATDDVAAYGNFPD